MEWFWQLNETFQKKMAASALKNFSSTDWIMMVVIFWGLIQGSRKGLADMFGSLLRIFLVSMLTLSLYPGAATSMCSYLPVFPVKVAEPMIFFILGVFFWILMSWCINFFGKLFKVKALGFLEVSGGMVFGGLRMLLALSFLAQFLLLFPIESVQQTFKEGRSFTGYTIAQVAPTLREFITSPFFEPVAKKIKKSVKAGG